MQEEIVPGDKRLRVILVALLLVAATLLLLSPTIGDIATAYDPAADPECVAQDLALRGRLIAVLGAVPLIGIAVYFLRVGWHTLRDGAWPPERMKVPWSLVRRRGAYAVAMGAATLLVASLFALQAGASIWLAWRPLE
jgi:hypothetical protein